MNLLLDTHLLLWAAMDSRRLSSTARGHLLDPKTHLWFSAASIWEVVIKSSLGRPDFAVDAAVLRRGLLINGYQELPVTGMHAIGVAASTVEHRDPFDRILLAQAAVEGFALGTADKALIGLTEVLDLR